MPGKSLAGPFRPARVVRDGDARRARRAIWIWWDARFFEAESGGEFQAIGRDITEVRRLRVERDRAREEARAADLASQRLGIAHDLHDTLARSIVTLILEMGLVAKTTADPAAREKLVGLQARARAGLAKAREAITQLRAIRREESDPRQIVEAFEKRARATSAWRCAPISRSTLPRCPPNSPTI